MTKGYSIEDQLTLILEDYEKIALEEVDKIGEEVCKTGKNRMKDLLEGTLKYGPSQKHYRDCFTIRHHKDAWGITVVLWNKKYQLSHLIEDGHKMKQVRNPKYPYNRRKPIGSPESPWEGVPHKPKEDKRAKGYKAWKTVKDEMVEKFEKEVRAVTGGR